VGFSEAAGVASTGAIILALPFGTVAIPGIVRVVTLLGVAVICALALVELGAGEFDEPAAAIELPAAVFVEPLDAEFAPDVPVPVPELVAVVGDDDATAGVCSGASAI